MPALAGLLDSHAPATPSPARPIGWRRMLRGHTRPVTRCACIGPSPPRAPPGGPADGARFDATPAGQVERFKNMGAWNTTMANLLPHLSAEEKALHMNSEATKERRKWRHGGTALLGKRAVRRANAA